MQLSESEDSTDHPITLEAARDALRVADEASGRFQAAQARPSRRALGVLGLWLVLYVVFVAAGDLPNPFDVVVRVLAGGLVLLGMLGLAFSPQISSRLGWAAKTRGRAARTRDLAVPAVVGGIVGLSGPLIFGVVVRSGASPAYLITAGLMAVVIVAVVCVSVAFRRRSR